MQHEKSYRTKKTRTKKVRDDCITKECLSSSIRTIPSVSEFNRVNCCIQQLADYTADWELHPTPKIHIIFVPYLITKLRIRQVGLLGQDGPSSLFLMVHNCLLLWYTKNTMAKVHYIIDNNVI